MSYLEERLKEKRAMRITKITVGMEKVVQHPDRFRDRELQYVNMKARVELTAEFDESDNSHYPSLKRELSQRVQEDLAREVQACEDFMARSSRLGAKQPVQPPPISMMAASTPPPPQLRRVGGCDVDGSDPYYDEDFVDEY